MQHRKLIRSHCWLLLKRPWCDGKLGSGRAFWFLLRHPPHSDSVLLHSLVPSVCQALVCQVLEARTGQEELGVANVRAV